MLDVLAARGVDTFVISPGSRNAPLIIAADCREELKKYIIIDERTAAFVALGIARVTRKPVGLICTSGTALYNYAPAVAEAFYQNIPLIVISADRPAEWIDQDDSQTLVQPEALHRIVKGNYDLAADPAHGTTDDNYRWMINRMVNEALTTAISNRPGPVHINVRLDVPLNKTVNKEIDHLPRIIRTLPQSEKLTSEALNELSELVIGRKIMIVAGFMPPDSRLSHWVKMAAELPQVTLLAEPLSNLFVDGKYYQIDSLLSSYAQEQLAELKPDVVISIGGALVSRMLKDYLRSCKGIEHITAGETRPSSDCFKALSWHTDVPAYRLIKAVTMILRKNRPTTGSASYSSIWDRFRVEATKVKKRYIDEAPWSELKAFNNIVNMLPADSNVMLSNGTPVRYMQLLIDRLPHALYGNRGVSGIEGTSATAVGLAAAYPRQTVLITGDMSFSYAPGIMALRPMVERLKIILINNSGGGIFRFIPATRDLSQRDRYFCANPELPVEALTRAYGWEYLRADSETTLRTALRLLLYGDKPTLLEITVDAEVSAQTLIEYFNCKVF